MNIVSQISSVLGVSPTLSPSVPLEIFPLPFSKYITLYNEVGIQSNAYDYFNDVIFDIHKSLSENGIKIIQFLNSPSEKRFINCHYIDRFSYSQMNYLIRGSLCHVCTDTYSNEICGLFSVPSICLVGNRFSENSLPWYGSPGRHFAVDNISPLKPSFSIEESPKSINKIKTEEVSSKILSLLGIENGISYKTLFTGSRYHEPTICDIIPNFEPVDKIYSSLECRIRFDKVHDEEKCLRFCASNKFSLATHKKISQRFFDVAGKNCKLVSFLIDSDSEAEEVRAVVKRGIPIELLFKDNKEDEALKFKFMDIGTIKSITPESRPEDRKSFSGKSFRSSKIIVSENKKYASYAHLEKSIPIGIINDVIDSDLFWLDDNRYKIFEQQQD